MGHGADETDVAVETDPRCVTFEPSTLATARS